MPDSAYDAPVFHDGIWYPSRNTRVSGRLVSVTGVAYEFAPDRVIPHLNLMVPAAGFATTADPDGTYRKIQAGRMIEVHCFPARLLREVEAVRPREGEDVEITTSAELVNGFLTYVVSAGNRWSTAEHWAPEDASVYCAFGVQHLRGPETPAERTQAMTPVSPPAPDSNGSEDTVKPDWPSLIGGASLFTPGES